jgi:hypothetical protein
MSTAREKRHLSRLSGMQCICCKLLGQQQESRTEIHHPRDGQGMAQRASNWLGIPLCGEGCHRGPLGVHGDRTFLKLLKMTELDLLAATLAEVLP